MERTWSLCEGQQLIRKDCYSLPSGSRQHQTSPAGDDILCDLFHWRFPVVFVVESVWMNST